MEVRSLAWRTDLMFARFDGRVTDKGDHLVVETPANPGFHWGNFLLFRRPPRSGDLPRWKRAFRRAFGGRPRIRHMAFGWDDPSGGVGVVGPFLREGFAIEKSVVLAASSVRRPRMGIPGLKVRPLSGRREWDHAFSRLDWLGAEELGLFQEFRRRQGARYWKMAAAGRGGWYGAFLRGTLIGGLGLFAEDGVGRFQSVAVASEFRGRGVARSLVHAAARRALADGVRQVVVVSARAELYEACGFRRVERQACLCKA